MPQSPVCLLALGKILGMKSKRKHGGMLLSDSTGSESNCSPCVVFIGCQVQLQSLIFEYEY